MTQSYPLQWPVGRPRTKYPKRSQFKDDWTVAKLLVKIKAEIHRMRGMNAVISTNIPLKMNGDPYSNRKPPDDQGVAVYFDYKGKSKCYCCDKWKTIESNMRAIELCIAATRGLERWGGSDMIDAAFSGFEALPDNIISSGASFNYFDRCDSLDDVKEQYRVLCKTMHPDKIPENVGDEERKTWIDRYLVLEEQFKTAQENYGG